MIEKMKAKNKEVQVYTAQKSPHGFYWARSVSAARDLRGEKTKEEENEELIARRTIIEFFTKNFGREDLKTEESPSDSKAPRAIATPSEQEPARSGLEGSGLGGAQGRGLGAGRGGELARGGGMTRGGADFKSLAGVSDKITKESFKQKFSGSPTFTSRPELIDQLFSRLDTDSDGALTEKEFEAFGQMRGQSRGQMGQGGNRLGMRQENRPAGQPSPNPDVAKATPVRIQSGELVGLQQSDVRIFRGIPYAAAPVGELRWRSPKPFGTWTGIREATQFGAQALQGETFGPRSAQSDDCLFLNVWTPNNADANSKLPVLVWFHGGAFIQGSGAQPRYDGTELARRGAVVITINYRLGPMGLFAHPALTAESAPNEPLGNFCLLDMMAALTWTRENIAAFGGDPNNVTISGSSAGGTSCLFLMGIPQAEGLFHKAIIHSSGGMQNIQTLAEAEAAGVRLAEQLGIGANASASDLRKIAAGDAALGVAAIRQLNLPVKPIVDGRLVKFTPSELFAQGKQTRIPVLIGGANGESGARQLGDQVATGGAFSFQRDLVEQMHKSGQPVWMFQLTFVPPQSRNNRIAAQHGETVAYSFGTIGHSIASQHGFRNEQVATKAMQSRRGGGRNAGGGREDDSQPVEESEQGRKISAAMMDYWIAFMKDGKPSGKDLPDWPAYRPSEPKVMVFGNESIAAK
jgi:para-nitrobenzyl esterase